MLKTDDGVYAYDTDAVEDEKANDVRSVWIFIAQPDGYSEAGYFVSCRTNSGELIGANVTHHNGQEEMLMVEGNAKPSDPGWGPLPQKGVTKIAVDVACARHIEGAIRVDDQKTAIEKLKTLSN